jgi:hypothetical protein
VVAAEWYSNRTVPGGGPETGTRLGHASGNPDEFDSVEEAVSDTVDTTGWTLGRHAISVRGQDANGTWGPAATYVVNVTAGGTGGGGGGTAAGSTTVVAGSAQTNGGGTRFGFDLDSGGTTVTLANASIDTSTMPGGVRDRLQTISLAGGNVRAGGGRFSSDGSVQQLDTTGTDVSGTARLEFANFASGPGNSQLTSGTYTVRASPPVGNHLTVTLGFTDGSTRTLYLEAP